MKQKSKIFSDFTFKSTWAEQIKRFTFYFCANLFEFVYFLAVLKLETAVWVVAVLLLLTALIL